MAESGIFPKVSVVIAARNAAATISQAVRSALREPEVVQVLVVDDASDDRTSEVANAADDFTGRLVVHRLDINGGPSAARNYAFKRATAPFVAILDADDCLLEGRFRALLADTGWDIAADNIMFVGEENGLQTLDISPPSFAPCPRYLSLAEFVDGNISKRGVHRGELGFLKPVIRREFLETHGLHYDEGLRLGEDYDLYVRAMVRGARFRIIQSCGYVATVRPGSLSGRHRTEDLRRLADVDIALLASADLSGQDRAALRRHERHIRDRYRLRHFLDRKSANGLPSALAYAFSSAANPWPIFSGVARDKLDAAGRRLSGVSGEREKPAPVRFLMPASPR